MARHNIVFGKDRAFTSSGYAGFSGSQVDDRSQGGYGQAGYGQQAPAQRGYGQPYPPQPGHGQQAPASRDDLEAMYARPAATGYDTGRMTMRDALNAITATLGTIIVVGFAVGMLPVVLGAVAGAEGEMAGVGLGTAAMIVGIIGGTILAFVNIFKKTPSPALVLAYAAFEGLLLGGISGVIDYSYSGPSVALQAVGGTLAVAGTVLVLFRAGVLRTSPRLTKIFMVAMVGYLVFGLVNIGVMIATGTSLRDGLLGLAIGAIAVVLASYSLVMDFEDITHGVKNGVPRRMAWRCAFGVAVTLVWMYLEILRILAILRNN